MENSRGVTVLFSQGEFPNPCPARSGGKQAAPGGLYDCCSPGGAAQHLPSDRTAPKPTATQPKMPAVPRLRNSAPRTRLPLPPHGQSTDPLYGMLWTDMFAEFCKGTWTEALLLGLENLLYKKKNIYTHLFSNS